MLDLTLFNFLLMNRILQYNLSYIVLRSQVQSDSTYSDMSQRDLLMGLWLVSLIQLKSYKPWMMLWMLLLMLWMLLFQNCHRIDHMSGYRNIPIHEHADSKYHLIRSSTTADHPAQMHCDNNYYQCLNQLF